MPLVARNRIEPHRFDTIADVKATTRTPLENDEPYIIKETGHVYSWVPGATSADSTKSIQLTNFPTLGRLIASSTDYASADLIANADHTHTWADKSKTEEFTTGADVRHFADGNKQNTVTNSIGENSAIIVDYDNPTRGVFSQTTTSFTTGVLNLEGGGTGGGAYHTIDRDGINLQFFNNADLKLNSNAGNSGQVLVSMGAAQSPIWGDLSGIEYKPISIDYQITDADNGKVLELNGALTVTIGILTDAFRGCRLVQMTADKSTIAGTYTGDYGQTTTWDVIGSVYEVARQTDGSVFFHISI